MFERAAALPAKVLLAIALAVGAAFASIGFTTPWYVLELKGFDALTRATAPNASRFPITVVAIDEASFARVGRQWPWPRATYARLIDQLARSGALVIALDVTMSEPSNAGPDDDRALAEAIRRAGNVVVASERVYEETAVSRQWLRVDPLPQFTAAGARNGYVNVELDPDLVARRIPFAADAFWKRIVERLQELQPGLVNAALPRRGAMIRYAGGDHVFPYVSFYQVLDADKYLPPDAFRDQIVLVGRDIKANVDARAAQADLFATPFTGSSGGLMPGVELHANVLETAFRGAAVNAAPPWAAPALVLAAVALCALTLRHWRPLVGAAAAVAIVAGLGGLDAALFQRADVWLPVFAAMASAVAMYVACGAVAYVSERRRRGEIRRAFSLYVSPEVVDHVMAHPERLALGGERREVTMMFTDLEGFTTLSERLDAEQVARILNMHFTRATAIVKRHRGTVNRFIGDAIMAMWGAPVADPDQAYHACIAAVQMQRDMEALRAELALRGLPPIRMRIGLHCCVAVVGNLGSSDRFDYTAIGDGVNLAARLEGVNKAYRTGILLSGETARRVAARIALREVDRVIVKGKTEAVAIFTPCDDAQACELNARAIAAERERRWDEAEASWRGVLERLPDDGIAPVHLDRIAAARMAAPGTAWRDAVELEKL
ncbi:MAG TPA: adenylate/guanylate cyclase domain-containing protein [Usitatibacter sp.]|nr:adenylate/guanylate cyclase domain-containing protein [Usitatibacter sp.]